MAETLELIDTDGLAALQADLLCGDFNLYAQTALAPLNQRPARHHVYLNRKLQDLAEGKIDRLMVLMPPGSAKSTYCTILYPSWALKQPSIETMIQASASANLAEGFMGKAHRVAQSMEDVLRYQFLQARADYWRTTDQKEVRAFGAGAGTAGRRADLIGIDDPFGSWEDANRQAQRDMIWDWYTGDLVGRLKPGGRILLVNTHWHEDDLAGRLMADMREGGDQWEIVCMQAIYDGSIDDPMGRAEGEALWPEWENVDALLRKRRTIGEFKWAALYQQNPRPDGGLMFKIDNIKAVTALPDGPRRTVRRWDLAGTEEVPGRKPDWTVGVKMTEINGHYYIEAVERVRATPAAVKRLMRSTAEHDGRRVRIGFPQEPGAAGKFVVQDIGQTLAGFALEAERETGSKVDRASPFASQAEIGNVSMIRGEWNKLFLDELAVFPNGQFDDQVDAGSGAFKMLCNTTRKTSMKRVNLMGR